MVCHSTPPANAFLDSTVIGPSMYLSHHSSWHSASSQPGSAFFADFYMLADFFDIRFPCSRPQQIQCIDYECTRWPSHIKIWGNYPTTVLDIQDAEEVPISFQINASALLEAQRGRHDLDVQESYSSLTAGAMVRQTSVDITALFIIHYLPCAPASALPHGMQARETDNGSVLLFSSAGLTLLSLLQDAS